MNYLVIDENKMPVSKELSHDEAVAFLQELPEDGRIGWSIVPALTTKQALVNLIDACERAQDWSGTRIGNAMDEAWVAIQRDAQ